MGRGAPFPPIRVAQVGNSLLLVDGWHRLAAAQEAELDEIGGLVEPMTRREALKAAACANSTHGKPLNRAERRNAFKLFVKGGGHRSKEGYLSYREISACLGGLNSHTSIRNWMLRDFRKIANAMGGTEGGNSLATLPPLDEEHSAFIQAQQALWDLESHYSRFSCPESRYAFIERVAATLEKLKEEPHEKPQF
jgi:hypothetical protein